MILFLLCARSSSCACKVLTRSLDCASAGDCGSVFATLEARLLAMDEDMLMNTGEEGATSLRVVALGLSATLGRLRLRIGVGC